MKWFKTEKVEEQRKDMLKMFDDLKVIVEKIKENVIWIKNIGDKDVEIPLKGG